jgi:hypothetical protein
MKNLHTSIASTSFRDRCFEEDADFGIALDHSNSLDRILQIVVIDDPIETHSNTEDCSTSADWASHDKRREGIKNENGIHTFSPKPLHFVFFDFPVFEILEGKIIYRVRF